MNSMRTIHFSSRHRPYTFIVQPIIMQFIRYTLRMALQNKLQTGLKALALCIGTAACLLTTLFYLYESGYDLQHPQHDRLFRYVHQIKTGETLESLALGTGMTGPLMKTRFPEVEAYSRLVFPALSVRNKTTDISFNERRFGFIDPSFLEMFNFPVVGGTDPQSMLSQPYSVIVTPAMAIKYFGTTDVLGKTLLINGEAEFVIKGVFLRNPERSHIHFDFLASISTFESIKNHPVLSVQIPISKFLEVNTTIAFYTYLRLAPGALADDLIAKFPAFIEETRGQGRSERIKPTLQSVEIIHLNSQLIYEIQPNGTMTEVYIYLVVGLLILGIACINYVNASTAEFIRRQRSVGLKKILGAGRSRLMAGHLFETSVIAAISVLAGIGGAFIVLPGFNSITGRTLQIDPLLTAGIGLSLLVLIVVVSGTLPAIRIANIIPRETLRAAKTSTGRAFSGRTTLVFIQIGCSFMLLTLSMLLFSQFKFLLKRDLGFDTRNVMVINGLSADPLQRISFRDGLSSNAGVKNVSMCSSVPGRPFASCGVRYRDNTDEDHPMSAWQTFVDGNYLQTLSIGINEGRFFSESNAADTSDYVVLNTAAAAVIGGDAIERKLNVPVLLRNRRVDKTVVGVVPDFHFASLHHPVEPLLLEYKPERCGFLLVRLDESDIAQTTAAIGAKWKETFPTVPFDYFFLEDDMALLYGKESRQKDLLAIVAGISIALAALGIFGTTLFLAEARTKEMGIRKVLGSGRGQMLTLLFRPILILMLAACAVTAPIVFYAGSNWLEQYPYRTTFSPMLFIASFSIILLIMMVTVLNHFLRVTRVNPVDVLKENG